MYHDAGLLICEQARNSREPGTQYLEPEECRALSAHVLGDVLSSHQYLSVGERKGPHDLPA